MVTPERVQDECLVGPGNFNLCEPAVICEVHLCRYRARVQARRLGVQFQVDRFRRLDADNELVARDIFKDALGDILELDADFDFGLIESYSREA